MKKIKKIIAMGAIITSLIILASCGGPSTLEEYVNDNSDVQQSIESMEKTIGDNGSVTIKENNLTAIMVTHNMNDAIKHGNRLIMMNDGKIIFDVSGEEKKNLTVEDLLRKFSENSGEAFADDRAILG